MIIIFDQSESWCLIFLYKFKTILKTVLHIRTDYEYRLNNEFTR